MDINATEKLDSFESVADETIKAESIAEPSKTVKKQKTSVKECEVLYWNKHSRNFAFKYDGRGVQITLDEPMIECGSTVKVKYTDGKYEILER